jgi:GNAT superfamily N-acetyltransferase
VTTVRRIRPHERDLALATVVEAFRDDPQVRWYLPDDAGYDDGARSFFGLLLDVRVEGGEVWVTDDCSAVAMWNPPGGNLLGPEEAEVRYSRMAAALPAPSRERVLALDVAVDRLLPHEPHWYLGVLACHPGRQGQGLASAVMAPILSSADRIAVPVALETGTAANVAFYTRRGFAVTGQACLPGALGEPDVAGPPGGDLPVWVMRREPRP